MIMSRFKKILPGLLIVLIAIQFVRPARNRNDQKQPADLATICTVPDTVQGILQNACYDCHSNNTNYPWYANIQPLAWIMARHITKGKAQLNFSEFGIISKRKQISKLREMINQVKDDEMPLASYQLMHGNAKSSANKKTLLLNWLTSTADSLQNQ